MTDPTPDLTNREALSRRIREKATVAGGLVDTLFTEDEIQEILAALLASSADARFKVEVRGAAMADATDSDQDVIDQIASDYKSWMAACEAIRTAESWPPRSYPSMSDRWVYAALLQRAKQAEAREQPLRAALKELRHDANRLCDRQLGGTYEADCRRSIAVADAALALPASPRAEGRHDYGPDPSCKRCKGTGEEPNAQFRCGCRWTPRQEGRRMAEAEPCEWLEDADGVSQTACGRTFALDDSSRAVENGLRFCHFCGKRIKLTARFTEVCAKCGAVESEGHEFGFRDHAFVARVPPCANCGHDYKHDDGIEADACRHHGCECGFYVPAAPESTTPDAPTHFGSLGVADCGANYPDMSITTVSANATCSTCREEIQKAEAPTHHSGCTDCTGRDGQHEPGCLVPMSLANVRADAPTPQRAEEPPCPNCGCEEHDHRGILTCRCPASRASVTPSELHKAIDRLRWQTHLCGACGQRYHVCRGCGEGSIGANRDASAEQCGGHPTTPCASTCYVSAALAPSSSPAVFRQEDEQKKDDDAR